MTTLLDLLVLITTMSVFYLNMDFRYSRKRIIIIFSCFGIISFSIYTFIVHRDYNPELISSLCFSVPSLLICYWLSAYRGARFIFTFAIIDIIGMFAVILGRCISIPFNYNVTVTFIATLILLLVYLWGGKKISPSYLDILRSVKTGWTSIALAAIATYIFTFVLIAYPTPLNMRREYVPTILVYLLLVMTYLKVLYEASRNNIKIYNERLENENLKMKLELNKVYYDMAYRDSLTGVNNRNAFEEYVIKTEKNKQLDLICLSVDINCLKKVNDQEGHYAGDQLIINVGHLLLKTFGPENHIFRIGGDEFLVIIEGRTVEWLTPVLQKMDYHLEIMQKNQLIPYGCARGVSHGKAEKIHDLIKSADQKMYQFKRDYKLKERQEA